MDPEALNYNPDADEDDGSCIYEYGGSCEYPLDGGVVNGDTIYAATTEAGDADWYSFVVDADYENISVSLCGSGFDTKLEVWGACTSSTYLGYNDDALCGNFNSQVDLTNVAAGTYHAKVYGYSSEFGDYILTITAWDNPTEPVLTATGGPGAVLLNWEPVPTRGISTDNISIIPVNEREAPRLAPEQYSARTNIVNKVYNRNDTGMTINLHDSWGDGWNGNVLTIGENSFTLDAVNDDGANASFELTLEDGTYDVTCDGGSWQSEVTWEIVETASGTELLAGGAPYTGYLVLGETSDVLGCMDAEALNYGFNCAGEDVGTPTLDDGCCEYPAPANDLCENAEAVASPY